MPRLLAPLTALGVLSACAMPAPEKPGAPERCWASETLQPAIYEQVMGEVQVVPAEIAADGTVLRAPVYRRAPVPRVVRPRDELRFEAPCPDALTPEFIASLQRALAARGLFDAPISGELDTATRSAIRGYQSARGLDSDRLSAGMARDLGLMPIILPTPSDR